MDRPTFSQSWSRVSRLTPMLRPQVQVRRRTFRGQPWYVLHDAISNTFFRLNPVAFHLVGLLDGQRSVDEVWRMTLERHGDEAPTQNEVIGLLGQLNQSNLLRVDLPADAQPLLQRQQRRRMRRWAGAAMSVMFLQIPVLNPDRLLTWLLPVVRPILSWWGLMLWSIWMIVTSAIFLPHVGDFYRDTGSLLAPANWAWMAAVFVLIKIFHELGHGLICRRLGGSVQEAGIMLLVLFPTPYVDTTSAWGFGDKWKRMLVGAAGMIFELAVAGGAALIWLHAEPGTLTRQVAHSVVLLASVATVLFNANPLMRFDGYFILSDFLEIPNLYDRSNQHLRYLGQRFALGMKAATPVSSLASERRILLFYGIGAAIYRFVIMFGIIFFIAGKFFVIGLVLAVWTAVSWAVVPTARLTHWLATGSALHRQRGRAVAVCLAGAVALVVTLGLIPMPDHRRTVGVVEAAERTDLAPAADGFVTDVKAEAGEFVHAGQDIMVLDDPVLRGRRRELEAQLDRLEHELQQSVTQKPSDRQVALAHIVPARAELEDADKRLRSLVVKSPRDGMLVGPALWTLRGMFLKRGQVFAQVLDLTTARVTALVDQGDNAIPLADPQLKVELRSAGDLTDVVPSSILQKFDTGTTILRLQQLGSNGGETIPTDPNDPKGRTTLRPQFEVWLALPPGAAIDGGTLGAVHKGPTWFYPGQRVYVQFTLSKSKPLLAQWIHRFRQMFRERMVL